MNQPTIYHNPRCSKSRETLTLLRDRGHEPRIIEYLKEPPTEAELETILIKLGIRARDLVRKKETLYLEKFEGKELTEAEWIRVLAENPILIERPIVITEKGAALGRPPENVLPLF